jgi:hypothetical protein
MGRAVLLVESSANLLERAMEASGIGGNRLLVGTVALRLVGGKKGSGALEWKGRCSGAER